MRERPAPRRRARPDGERLAGRALALSTGRWTGSRRDSVRTRTRRRGDRPSRGTRRHSARPASTTARSRRRRVEREPARRSRAAPTSGRRGRARAPARSARRPRGRTASRIVIGPVPVPWSAGLSNHATQTRAAGDERHRERPGVAGRPDAHRGAEPSAGRSRRTKIGSSPAPTRRPGRRERRPRRRSPAGRCSRRTAGGRRRSAHGGSEAPAGRSSRTMRWR